MKQNFKQQCKYLQVNEVSTDNDASALLLACAHGHWEIVRLLLDHGADPSHVFKVGLRSKFREQGNLIRCSIYKGHKLLNDCSRCFSV